MKTRQPSPACAGTAFNIVISLADPIRCGLSAALAAEIGWTRRPDATWAEAATIPPLFRFRAPLIFILLRSQHHDRCAPRDYWSSGCRPPATAVGWFALTSAAPRTSLLGINCGE